MSNENDWKELEEWELQRKLQEKEKLGIDLDKIDIPKQEKKINKLVKRLKFTGKVSKYFAFTLFILFGFAIFSYIILNFSNIRARVNVDIEQSLKNIYNVNIEVVAKDVDEKGNGKYIFKAINNNDIQFTAIKNFGSLTQDYPARSHKYYFELWNSGEKGNFIVNEFIDNDILTYETYINIEDVEDLEIAINEIVNFVNFCGEKFYPNWNIYLQKDGRRIYPYSSYNMTAEDVMNNAKKIYNEMFTKNKNVI